MLNRSRVGLLSFIAAPLWLLCLRPQATAAAQSDGSQLADSAKTSARSDVAQAMERIRTDNFWVGDSNLAAEAGMVDAVPYLKKAFEASKEDVLLKCSVASALVRFGDTNPAYWDYLVQGASDLLASDVPDPAGDDRSGKVASSQFLAWAKARNLTQDAAEDLVLRGLSFLTYLGESRDRRAVPLLRQALLASYNLIRAAGARGLAHLQDTDSIPMIIAACRQAPSGKGVGIASMLREFNDPQAQSAAKEFGVPEGLGVKPPQ